MSWHSQKQRAIANLHGGDESNKEWEIVWKCSMGMGFPVGEFLEISLPVFPLLFLFQSLIELVRWVQGKSWPLSSKQAVHQMLMSTSFCGKNLWVLEATFFKSRKSKLKLNVMSFNYFCKVLSLKYTSILKINFYYVCWTMQPLKPGELSTSFLLKLL